MRRIFARLTIALIGTMLLFGATERSPFAGRWDLTIHNAAGSYPSWMQFADEGGAPVVRIVGRAGSVHPARDVKVEGTHLTFQDGLAKDGAAEWLITVRNHKLSGQTPSGKLTGVPAPALDRATPRAWSKPEPLFDGRDLTGWQPDNPATNHWIVQNGELQNTQAGANIRTTHKFDDFKLHVEYNCPQGGNSGVYLRGRYEVQVEYEPPAKNDIFHGMGSIYGFIPPATEVQKRPGEWESYDVTLVGRTVTVVRDGVLIIHDAEIPGITGGALDSHEGEPGPIYLQGDHAGGLKFRNITISVPQR